MKMHDTPLAGLFLIETAPKRDTRGQFVRVFCEEEYASIRKHWRWTQVNLSNTSHKGTIRGMHFQYPPAAEAKLIRCLRGRVFDVAIDLRAGSPTFMRWHGVELSEDSQFQYFIPEGFAHGFQTLTDDVQMMYLHTNSWSREHEGAIRYDDPLPEITWPLTVTQISEKDRNLPFLTAQFKGITP